MIAIGVGNFGGLIIKKSTRLSLSHDNFLIRTRTWLRLKDETPCQIQLYTWL